MKLTPHFTLSELTITSTGLKNEPSERDKERLVALAVNLEHIRTLLGNKPLFITSAYRNEIVNQAVGGVSNSDHRLGYAADFKHSYTKAIDCAKIIAASPLAFDQLILERRNTLIHISFNPRLRREILRQPGGPGTPFIRGLGD